MDIFIARQPIFGNDEKVFAYEILYRSGFTNVYDGLDGDKASMEVIINTFQNFGIDTITGRKPAFINFTENLLTEGIATLFPKKWLVVEVIENIEASEEILKSCKDLRSKGYRIALDDFLDLPNYEPLIKLANIIKIDFLNMKKSLIEEIRWKYRNYDVEFLAEKIETREEFQYAKDLGFKYFQGYFFSKPEILSSRRLLPIKANQLQLIAHINSGELNFEEIANIIKRDLSLTYNLFKLVNSEVFNFRHRINDVKLALVALGEKEIRKWIYLILLNEMGSDRPDELTRLSLIRARFMELLSLNSKIQNDSKEIFLIGLFSLLDVILRRPLDEILEEIKATEIIKNVLIEDIGEASILYRLIIEYELGNWDKVEEYASIIGINPEKISVSYIDALSWYHDLIK